MKSNVKTASEIAKGYEEALANQQKKPEQPKNEKPKKKSSLKNNKNLNLEDC